MEKKNMIMVKNYIQIMICQIQLNNKKHAINKYLKNKNYILYILKDMDNYYVDHLFSLMIKLC